MATLIVGLKEIRRSLKQRGKLGELAMKVLLIELNYNSHIVHPPLGLGYIASFIEGKGYEVDIYDGNLENASEDDFLTKISEFEPNLIGISLKCQVHASVKRLVNAIKINFPTPIVLGGPQATAYPREILEDIKADFVVVGEGELTVWELVDALENGKEICSIHGLVFRTSSGEIVVNKARSLIPDIDSLPFPAWHLMPPTKYRIEPILAPSKNQPVAPIITSRGCPYQCTFCATNATWRRKLRLRSAQNVLEEIKLLVDKFGVNEIHITDDNVTFNQRHIESLCDVIMDSGIDISWQCPNGIRIDTLNIELLEKMKAAGCYSLGIGIESGNQDILKRIKKRLDLRKVEQVLKDIEKVGMQTYGFFIIGLPGETEYTIRETINFAKNNPFDRAWFNILTPYPGSEIFQEFLGDKSFSEIEWESFDTNTGIVCTSNLPRDVIERYQRQAVREFYLRPKIIVKLVKQIGLAQIKTLLMTSFFRKVITRVLR